MEQFRLVRGGVTLGIVTHTPDEQIDGAAWDIGRLEPSPKFETVRHLFEREQRLPSASATSQTPGRMISRCWLAARSSS